MCYHLYTLNMSWREKSDPTDFESLPIEGLFFLDSEAVFNQLGAYWVAGLKYPLIEFPSGLQCQLWETSDTIKGAIVHIFGEMDLPLYSTRDEAFEQANDIAEQCGYIAKRRGEDTLEVWGHETDEHFYLHYNNPQRRLADITRPLKENRAELRPPTPLLTEELKATLPKLYANETLGLDALAQVKFFTPDGNWTWYASEFDGQDTFFGLVVGLETELGYFSLSELENVRGRMGLPVERDRHFAPKTLRELKALHLKEWHDS